MASFEPALDYCVVKIPRWPFDKFRHGDRRLGSQMKATGEVMAIDRCFEAALQKAVRGLETDQTDLTWEDSRWQDPSALEQALRIPTDQRLWAVAAALRRGWTPEHVSALSGIDTWFVRAIQRLVEMEQRLASEPLTAELLWEAKRLGFADRTIAALRTTTEQEIRAQRLALGLAPVYKLVDTCAAEFAAETPYFYATYEDENEAPRSTLPRLSSSAQDRSASVRASSSITVASRLHRRSTGPVWQRSCSTTTPRPFRPTSTHPIASM